MRSHVSRCGVASVSSALALHIAVRTAVRPRHVLSCVRARPSFNLESCMREGAREKKGVMFKREEHRERESLWVSSAIGLDAQKRIVIACLLWWLSVLVVGGGMCFVWPHSGARQWSRRIRWTVTKVAQSCHIFFWSVYFSQVFSWVFSLHSANNLRLPEYRYRYRILSSTMTPARR